MTRRFFFSEPQANPDQNAEIDLWNSVKDAEDPAIIRKYLIKYPLGSFAVVARNLIVALEQQQEMAKAVLENEKKYKKALRKADEDLKKAQAAAKTAGTRVGAETQPVEALKGKENKGGYRTCGRNGCQWVPPGCHAIRGGGGGGLGGKIVCP